ncbi:ABC-type siderophore export system fused ATPase/permease subunit [Pseudomonas citronellolis]|nr:ABC-type siderophore export system fused ATPase/permease subunit [Pseudomonas citronellolis]MCP1667874.1 ABC-type siderophore export system fused ATPase/permease subunit [Pseudomonas citronellolis]MCP1699030.1 ABC-type siderophore export system fused ATPase/permease subunit [Pseudomonas citronellolis]MCP1704981.1 ABC-type siderophore export system fused ATPase/permease subunit [Pseudomonas citronellolis]MCP1799593.1 ABC-type siderophore export system fused ATPase/permease subunit [Pseudomona
MQQRTYATMVAASNDFASASRSASGSMSSMLTWRFANSICHSYWSMVFSTNGFFTMTMRSWPRSTRSYRQQCSAVFSDYHLFDDLLAETAPLLERARHYLRLLELEGKVDIVDGVFSTLDLSAGQRKRLALVHAFLEQRPLMLFDEWAADQDPTFRRVFYEELLPDLKRQGKTLIVVSHDDRFFHHADQLVQLRNRRVVD